MHSSTYQSAPTETSCTEVPISVQLDTHDRSQIEISLGYRFSSSRNFDIDLFFFLPRSFGIHSNSYTKEQFYNDLINHLRFHPKHELDPERVTLDALVDTLGLDTTAQERERLTPLAGRQVKLFTNLINSRLKKLHDQCRNGQDSDSWQSSFDALYNQIKLFRNTFTHSSVQPNLRIPPSLRQTLLHSDEFLSNRMVATCSDLIHQTTSQTTAKHHLALISPKLHEILAHERKHRKTMGGLFVDVGTHERNREHFYYRHSLLKKEIAQPLYIDKKNAKQEKIYKNWVAGTGAALAGFWAQVADFQTRRMSTQKDLGLSIYLIGTVAVLAYVFKDRLKDLSKEYIQGKMKLFLPDYRSTLEFSEPQKNGSIKKTLLGKLSEYMRFLHNTHVPEDISYIRRLESTRDLDTENQENIIHYHKSLHLQSDPSHFSSKDGFTEIKDIHRFNFSYFLNHLDDARKEISVYDEDEGAARISAPKVYHINIVSHVTAGDFSIYNHYRVIVDKEGISRMEEVLPALHLTTREGLA